MHPDRLNYLAYNNKPERKVVSVLCRTDGTTFQLECGHYSDMPPHFSHKNITSRKCFECGVEYVKNSPRWAHEFKEE